MTAPSKTAPCADDPAEDLTYILLRLRKFVRKTSPNDARDGLIVDLHGDLAGILAIAEATPESQGRKKAMHTVGNTVLWMVGPAGFEPATKPL